MKPLPKMILVLVGITFLSQFTFPQKVQAQTDPGDISVCSTADSLQVMDKPICEALVGVFSQDNNPTNGPWYNQNTRQFAEKVLGGNQDEIFGERYTYAQINWILNSIATMLNPGANIKSASDLIRILGVIKSLLQADINNPPTIAQYAQLGPIGLFAGGIGTIYSNPPASGVQEIKYTAQRIFDAGTGTQPAYAQGYGFSSLRAGGSVRALWTASRNMAYLITVILLIASGFLIMFRVKINPQTVVSLQLMIPKLIITLLLVTFSFAIAGFVIDLIYVAIVAFTGFLSINNIITGQLPQTIDTLTNRSFPFYIMLQIPLTLLNIILLPLLFGIGGALGGILLGGAGLVFVPMEFLIGLAVAIVFAIWPLIILFKIFVMLAKSYVMLILLIIIGPLQIMLGLIPAAGSNQRGQPNFFSGFGGWLRSLISHASVFVTIPIMLVIQHVMSGNFLSGAFLNLTTFQNLGGAQLNLPFLGGKLEHGDIIITWLIGYTIFSLTPKTAEIIRDALKIPAFQYGAAIGEPLQPYSKAVGGSIVGYGKELKGPVGGFVESIGSPISGFITR